MKGVVLAGGTGSRLHPLTKSINKHCLPIYDQPMIYYPIESLVKARITEIILVAGGNHMSQFIDLLGDGSELGCSISYVAQMQPGGIAEAISLVEPFVDRDKICVILGDNIFIDDITPFVEDFKTHLTRSGDHFWDMNTSVCHLVCKEVNGRDAVNYGVLSHGAGDEELNKVHGQTYITEKPAFTLKKPFAKFKAVTGLYMYTPDVFKKIKMLTPSDRGELEVSELNDMFASCGDLSYSITKGPWFDCGVDIDHMLEVANEIRELKELE